MKRLYSWSGALIVLLLSLLVVSYVLSGALTQKMHAARPMGDTTGSSSNAEIPGNNLTLGKDTDAQGTFLIGYNGEPVYTYDNDVPGVSTCTGTCLTNWKSYVVSTSTGLVAEYPIAGKVSTLTRTDGSLQVTYKGQPLYFSLSATTTAEAELSWHRAKP